MQHHRYAEYPTAATVNSAPSHQRDDAAFPLWHHHTDTIMDTAHRHNRAGMISDTALLHNHTDTIMDTAHRHNHSDTAPQHNRSHHSMNTSLLDILAGVIKWPLFIASYEHSTTICGYSDDENLLRLQKALKGAALEAVGPLLLLPSGLKDAVATLRLRFGRPEVIVEGLIEKVKRMPAPRADRLETLAEFGFAVKNLCATIRASGLPEYTCNVVLLKELVAKLSSATCIEWARHRQRLSSVTLTEFGRWIGDLAEALSGVIPVRTDVADTDRWRSVKPSRPDPRRPTTAHLNVHAATSGSKYTTSPPKFQCTACQEECAALDGCPRFLRMSVAARKEHVKDRKLCRKCLKSHKGWCHLKTVCGSNGCEAMHHKLLHGALHVDHTPEKHCLTHSGTNDHTLFRYVPVTVHGGNGRTVQTFAFIDEGSSFTFMDRSLMEQLGLSGTLRPLSLKWTGDTSKQEKASMQLAVRISGTYVGAPVHELAKVHTVSNLALPAQSMNTQQLEAAYPHLKGLPVASYIDAVPRLLIGVDNCRLGKSLKCAEGRINEPLASKTRLGWMVYGPCPIATANVTGGHRSFHICSFDGNNDGALTTEDKAFDSLESLGVTKLPNPLKSEDDERALEILNRETKLQGDRFETGLLWRNHRLPYNKDAASRRHVTLKRKMAKIPELTAAVNQKVEDYIRRLSVSEVENKQCTDWLLPSLPVTKPNTKLETIRGAEVLMLSGVSGWRAARHNGSGAVALDRVYIERGRRRVEVDDSTGSDVELQPAGRIRFRQMLGD
uniref:Peptidase aspartic putative domain-containing protein n=1 Tax=Anopheles dirus TaxID=7168 RepID=A0A182NGE3_9DIPT